MQIFWEVKGYYERLTDGEKTVSKTSLANLFTDLRAIATDQKRYHLPAVHQSFGLNFLPVNAVIHLMQKTSGRSPLLADQTLRPFIQNPSDLKSQQFQYRFVSTQLSKNFAKNLESDDPQVPNDFGDRCAGTYQILLKNTPNSIIQKVQAEAVTNLNQFIKTEPLAVINLAFRSRNPELFAIPLPNNCTAWIQTIELHRALQRTIHILRNKSTNDFPNDDLTETVEKLIQAYRAKYPEPVIISDRIPNLMIANITPTTDIKIGRGIHRQTLEELITNAQKFLLICSYRLEDQAIVQMIAEKSKQIPIWILTDFSNNVQDRVDSNMDGQRESNPDYANSDLKKRKCFGMLSKARLGFRSGNFHLKTYISEQSAYLGSCNLTGGSLERNGEAGMLWKNTSEHQFLVEYFRYLWTHQTTSQSIPSPIGFRDESLEKVSGSPPQNHRFLDHHAFKQDLSLSLQRFAGQEIRIYTRTFEPLSPQSNLLTNPRNRIYFGNRNYTRLRANQIPNLHAKIIVIGSQVAYIGSQDFAFRPNPLLELTYKTTNPQEIRLITQQIKNLH
jgi:phosphatidylserine/phosphatidylglycerophosphate/cardiolipin synthase-like enzyme